MGNQNGLTHTYGICVPDTVTILSIGQLYICRLEAGEHTVALLATASTLHNKAQEEHLKRKTFFISFLCVSIPEFPLPPGTLLTVYNDLLLRVLASPSDHPGPAPVCDVITCHIQLRSASTEWQSSPRRLVTCSVPAVLTGHSCRGQVGVM